MQSLYPTIRGALKQRNNLNIRRKTRSNRGVLLSPRDKVWVRIGILFKTQIWRLVLSPGSQVTHESNKKGRTSKNNYAARGLVIHSPCLRQHRDLIFPKLLCPNIKPS